MIRKLSIFDDFVLNFLLSDASIPSGRFSNYAENQNLFH